MSKPSNRVAVVLALTLTLAAQAVVAQAPPPAAAPPPAQQGQPAQQAAPDVAAPAPPGQQAAPGAGGLLVPGSEFRYDETGRRDPFKSLLQLEKKQRDITQLPPIQQFDVEQAKVVGIIVDEKSGTQAMIKAPSGQTFVVRVGTIMGKNEGEVVEITLRGIRILEKFLDFMNRETRKETFLESHPTAGK